MKSKHSSGKTKTLFEDDDGSSTSSSSSESDDSSTSSSSSSSAEENVNKLTVNKSYAKAYESRKQMEELKTMRQQEDALMSDSSSSEEEDEDGQLLTPSTNVQFLKTIKALRSKDTSIYDPNTQFFDDAENSEEEGDSENGTKGKKRKPQRFKDVLREQILDEINEEGKEGEVAGNQDDNSPPRLSRFAYDEQQKELRKAFLKESKTSGDHEGDDNEESWMVVKERKVARQLDDDEEAEQDLLKDLKNIAKSSHGTSDKFTDPKGEVKDGEGFLLDYIKNKKWIDKNNLDSDDDSKLDDDSDNSSLNEMDKADDFEANYNFRFEHETTKSGAAFSVQPYARGNTMNTLRRKDTTRRDKRLARKERKAAERKAKEEQLKRLKNAKRQEMNQKLSQVKSVLGEVEEDAVDEAAIMKMLEGDYDPEKFENAMKQAYGDDYYEKQDAEWKTDTDVRESLKHDEGGDDLIGHDDLDGGLYDNYEDGEQEENIEGQDNVEENVDDEDDNLGAYVEEETELERKIKTKMQDELYKLDYEDVVAGMPTRFKYRQVEANSYGLSTQEILMARDTTLKQFVSLKKMAPYHLGEEFRIGSKKRRRFREMLKQEIEEEMENEQPAEEFNAENEETEENTEPKKKKRRRLKKNSKKKKDSDAGSSAKDESPTEAKGEKADTSGEGVVPSDNKKSKSKRRRKNGNKRSSMDNNTEDTTGSDSNNVEAKEPEGSEKMANSNASRKSKKKKRKKKKSIEGVSASRLASYGL